MTKHTVLIDDDNDDLTFFREAIVRAAATMHCETFDDPCEAVGHFEKLQHLNTDMIIIDFSMPRMNGLECLERLTKLRGTREIKFVIYSGSDLPEEIRNKICALGGRVVRKPFTYSEFHSLAAELVN